MGKKKEEDESEGYVVADVEIEEIPQFEDLEEEEEEEKKDENISRSVRITTPYTEISIGSEDKDEKLDYLIEEASKLMDKYKYCYNKTEVNECETA